MLGCALIEYYRIVSNYPESYPRNARQLQTATLAPRKISQHELGRRLLKLSLLILRSFYSHSLGSQLRQLVHLDTQSA